MIVLFDKKRNVLYFNDCYHSTGVRSRLHCSTSENLPDYIIYAGWSKSELAAASMELEWKECNFNELSTIELYQVLKLRTDVFVVEQDCAYPEVDGLDPEDHVMHLLGTSNGKVVAYGRVYKGETIRIGRVVIAKDFRGAGISTTLLDRLVKIATSRGDTIEIQAQSHLQNWYGRVGFRPVGSEYLEDGIPHIDMQLKVSPDSTA